MRLLLAGDDGLAWALARAAGESDLRCRILRFFAAAMGCAVADLEARLSQVVPAEVDLSSLSVDEARVLLAACLRYGLVSGYSPLGLVPLLERADVGPEALRVLIGCAVDAVQRGSRRPTAGDGAGYDELLKRWSDVAGRARALTQALLSRNTKYQRASAILHHLAKDDQILGAALAELAALAERGQSADGRDDPLAERLGALAARLGDRGEVRRVIADADAVVSTGGQRRKPIVAAAKNRLEDSIDEVRQLIDDALTARASLRQAERQSDLSQIDALRRAAATYRDTGPLHTVGAVALHRLALWIRQDPAPVGDHTLESLFRDALRLVYEVRRDRNGAVAVPSVADLSGVLAGRTVEEAVLGHLRHGNVAAARALVQELPPEAADRLHEECQRQEQQLVEQHRAAVARADAAIAKLRSVGRDETAVSLDAELEKCRSVPVDRFDLARPCLAAITERAEGDLHHYHRQLRARMHELSPEPAVTERLLGLLRAGDEVTVEEFLTLLSAGEPLPEPSADTGENDFTGFFPAVVEAACEPTRQGPDDVIASLAAHLGAAGATPGILAEGVEAWRSLRHQRRWNDAAFRRAVAEVLRMLGLAPAETNWIQDLTGAPRTGSALLRVRADPVDVSYVPQLGTQANGRYHVALMRERATPGRLLALIPEKYRTGANIILYFGVLSVEQRRQLRLLSAQGRDTSRLALVVDEAVIGWLATREEPSFRLTQRITLPFASINPYTPFAGGDVPDEVFVGRDRERAEVESPTGSMFVYGGRQLGKSALLRRVEKLYSETDDRGGGRRVALYLDLKSESIGEARKPEELWSLLNRKLKVLGVLPERKAVNAGPQSVADGIRAWLDRDDANRLLLLLDEADLFLTADYAAESDVAGRFPVLQRLKSLMESTKRRFKPVFAGLHQVQRFYDSANTPVAHGGADILIGPLRPQEVRKLVVDPLLAMGYQFQSGELVWRVAALTNYQASLVQIFCEALVRHLQQRPISAAGGRVVVTDDDISAVYASREVRNLIAQRFRWTINLDNRYRVIAIVMALLSLESSIGAMFDPEDLHEYCEWYWPEAFAGDEITRKEFVRYLDELVGLGVLRRGADDRYGIRSPNVVAMLGSRRSLDQELREASTHFELPYEYNPTTSRMPLPDAAGGVRRRSPLTDADLAHLLGERPGGSSAISKVARVGTTYTVAVVTGSRALGIDLVRAVIDRTAENRRIPLEHVDLSDVPEFARRYRRQHRLLLARADADSAERLAAHLCEALAALRDSRGARTIVIVDHGDVPGWIPNVGEALHIPLRRWSVEGLRAWHDFPFDTPEERRRLHALTSGWPDLVDRAVDLASGRSTEDVFDQLAAQPEGAGFLTDAGLSHLVDRIRQWVLYCGERVDGVVRMQPVTREDLDAILETDTADMLDELRALDVAQHGPAGWVLDSVVAAACLALPD